jgi:hypothetical protein
MATVVLNGRRVEIPPTATDEEIRQTGGIPSGRTLIKRERHGNFVIPRGSRPNIKDGDVFIDAPARIKG